MNIKHKGKTYEVLTLDRISEITHAKLAEGKVMKPEFSELVKEYYIDMSGEVWQADWEPLGIQPLRLVPKEPVTFEAWTAIVNFHGNDVVAIICPKDVHIDTKFQCVAVDK
jgi:hypothetical protein